MGGALDCGPDTAGQRRRPLRTGDDADDRGVVRRSGDGVGMQQTGPIGGPLRGGPEPVERRLVGEPTVADDGRGAVESVPGGGVAGDPDVERRLRRLGERSLGGGPRSDDRVARSVIPRRSATVAGRGGDPGTGFVTGDGDGTGT